MKRYVIALLLLVCACQEGGTKITETITVNPGSLTAGNELASYKVDVMSNTSWTVVLEDESGASVQWATLSRSSGRGNATVTVRVLENAYKDSRAAYIVFKTSTGQRAVVSLIQEGDTSSSTESGSVELRIGTYNLRTSDSDIGTVNEWSVRKDRLKQSILDCDFDIVALQELQPDQQAWLRSELGSVYDFRFFSPYSRTGAEGTKAAQGIGFKVGKISISDWHFFWAADNPDVMTEADVSPATGTGYNRGGCCGTFTHIASGVKIFVMNCHGCLFDDANAKYAHVYVDREKMYNESGLPSFFIGDMNESPNSTPGSPYMTYTEHWKDSYTEIDDSERTGPEGTYNGFNTPNGKTREDYVFFRGSKIVLKHYTCDKTRYDGKYASDHFPVYVDAVVYK